MKKEIFIMRSYERLLKYISFRTPSDGCSGTTPSSECQFALAHALTEELKELGVEDAVTDPFCYVYGHIPATPGYEEKTCIGFIAHMDTVPISATMMLTRSSPKTLMEKTSLLETAGGF
jgi:tripeptide aminopeptidase